MTLTRSADITFHRADGTVIAAPAVTRGQMAEVYQVDAELAGRTEPADMAERRGRQAAIFLRAARWLQADGTTPAGTLDELLPTLTADEEIDVIYAFTAQHHGINPTSAVIVRQAMDELAKKKAMT